MAHQDEEQHSYDDKFALAEFLVNTAIAAKMNALERLGLTSEKLQQVSKWVHEDKQSLTLRLQAEDYCTFVKDRMVEVSSSNSPSVERQYETTTTTTGGSFLGMGSTTQKVETVKTSVTTKIKEHHWKVGLRYRLVVFKGTNPDDPESMVELQSRSASTILITSGGSGSGRPTHPIPERTMHQPYVVSSRVYSV